jgi:hypothetical protein
MVNAAPQRFGSARCRWSTWGRARGLAIHYFVLLISSTLDDLHKRMGWSHYTGRPVTTVDAAVERSSSYVEDVLGKPRWPVPFAFAESLGVCAPPQRPLHQIRE